MEDEKNSSTGFLGRISRRTFLKGMGSGLLGSLLLPARGWVVFSPRHEVLRGKQKISLSVNGTRHTVEVEPRTTLLDAIHERLALTGSKKVCDRGQCGACTVLLDEKPILACMTLAVDVRDRHITTVEGLAREGELTALQQAFVEEDGLMCGFCTPGFVVAAAALLRQNPAPTLEEIKQGLAGNLCRCGTYPKVFQAVARAAGQIQKGG